MIRIEIKSDVKKKIRAFKKDVPKKIFGAIIKGTRKSIRHVGLVSARDFLHGPRPKRLDIRKGRLIRALTGGYSFSDLGPSRSESIEEIKISGKCVEGTKGVKEFKPFNYPRLWELTGHGGIKPKQARALRFTTPEGETVFTKRVKPQKKRPFLEPALSQAERKGELESLYQKELNDLVYS